MHPMVSRQNDGIIKPIEILVLAASALSPLSPSPHLPIVLSPNLFGGVLLRFTPKQKES
jgi:hypothetical protein